MINNNRRFNSYRQYLEREIGFRVQKVALNTGMGCPNRDGTLGLGGCTFCLNEAFTPSYCAPHKSVTQQIEEGIEFHSRRYAKSNKYLAYFQSFSNTYAPLELLKDIYNEAVAHPDVVGLVIGTRPDCIDSEKLDYFAELAEKLDYLIIEYGVESVYDESLSSINRGHNFECARKAIEMTAERGLHSGAHFIVGLPQESKEMILDSIDVINSMPLSTVKFHQLQLFKNTIMADEYAKNPEKFYFYGMEEYIDLFCDILERLRGDIILERFASEAPPRYHAVESGWGRVRNERLVQLLEKRLEERDTYQGRLYRG